MDTGWWGWSTDVIVLVFSYYLFMVDFFGFTICIGEQYQTFSIKVYQTLFYWHKIESLLTCIFIYFAGLYEAVEYILALCNTSCCNSHIFLYYLVNRGHLIVQPTLPQSNFSWNYTNLCCSLFIIICLHNKAGCYQRSESVKMLGQLFLIFFICLQVKLYLFIQLKDIFM